MLGKISLFLSAALGLSLLPAAQPASAQVIFMRRQPSVIIRQPAMIVREQPSVIIQEQRSVVTSSAPYAVPLPAAIGPISDFHHRLDLIRDQISLGSQSGMLSDDAAADLSRRQRDLSAVADGLMSKLPISQADNDSLENQINLLNQDVSHQMGQ